MIIGLTGGLASGKSTVEIYIKQRLCISVIDCDKIAIALLSDQHVLTEIRNRFGESVFKNNDEIDKNAMAAIVFNNLKAKRILEGIIHPRVICSVEQHITSARQERVHLVVSAPLLIEANINKLCDTVVTVECGSTNQIRYAVERGMDWKDAVARISMQLSSESRIAIADFVLWNISSKSELESKTLSLIGRILENAN